MKTLLFPFVLFFNFFICQQTKTPFYTPPPPPPSYYLNNGNINFTIPSNYIKAEVKGEIYDSFSPLFNLYELPMPKDLYVLPRNNSDLIMIMFTKNKTDYNLGKNENLSKQQMDLMLNEIKSLTNKGTLETFKINGINIIKHSYTVNSLRTSMYYIFDFDDMLFFLTALSGDIESWSKSEQKILNSFVRKKTDTDKISHDFFELIFNIDKNTEFSYGRDAVNEKPDVFRDLDKLAENAGIKEHINSKQLSKTANIYSKNIGGVMIVAKDIEYSIHNSELLNDATEVAAAKKLIDDFIDNDIPTNIDIIKSNKAEKYISKNGLCFIIKEVTAKKTDLLSGKVKFDNSMFIELFHKNKWYSIVGSYQSEKEKTFIYQIINSIELK